MKIICFYNQNLSVQMQRDKDGAAGLLNILKTNFDKKNVSFSLSMVVT